METPSTTTSCISLEAKTGCEKAWSDALLHCKDILGPDDYELVNTFESPEQLFAALEALQGKHNNNMILRLLKRSSTGFSYLQNFTVTLCVALSPCKISLACVWGVMSLLLELASKSERALSEISVMLEDIQHDLILFNDYSQGISLDASLLEVLFDILVDVLCFAASAIKHIRRNSPLVVTTVRWNLVQEQFAKVSSNLARRMKHLKERVEAENIKSNKNQAGLVQALGSKLNLSGKDDAETLPCHLIPFPRNPGFYGREKILEVIHGALQTGAQRVNSVAIWGTGGIGKSQIALEYANWQLQADVPVIIWVPSETKEELRSAFEEAAFRLGLAGVEKSNTPDQNRLICLQWLQKTDTRWLLIFDNVEDVEILQQNWPITGNGSVLVTCRGENVAAQYAAVVVEIPAFSLEEGSQLILRILNRDITPEERASSLQLSDKLGGLALALDLIAKQIRFRRKTITQFLPDYEKAYQVLHRAPKRGIPNSYYSKDLETVWKTQFDDLTVEAAALISIFCYFAPEAIPTSILQGFDEAPSGYLFLKDSATFDDAMMELLDLALIRVNPDTQLISMHRLIQVAYRDRLSGQLEYDAFKAALGILRSAFPEQGDGRHLRPHWKVCEQLIQHVQAFAKQYATMRAAGLTEHIDDITMLLSDASWYLHEIGAHASSSELLEWAKASCKDKRSIAYSNLLTTEGTNHDQRGHGIKAVVCFDEALSIRQQLLPENHEEIINSWSNAALGWVGIHEPEKALKLVGLAIDVDMKRTWEEQIRCNTDMRFRNRARIHNVMGEYEKAKKDVEFASAITAAKHPPGSYYEAEIHHMLAHIALNEGDFETSYNHEKAALETFLKVQPTYHYVSAAYYRLGLARMAQKDYGEALDLFRNALDICQLNEVQKGDKGESARVLWRMAQAFGFQGQHKAREDLAAAALTIFDSCHATGLYKVNARLNGQEPQNDTDWDGLMAFLYR